MAIEIGTRVRCVSDPWDYDGLEGFTGVVTKIDHDPESPDQDVLVEWDNWIAYGDNAWWVDWSNLEEI
jgi:hypothetical protein